MCLRKWRQKTGIHAGRTIKMMAQCLVHRTCPPSLAREREREREGQVEKGDEDWPYRALPPPRGKRESPWSQHMPALERSFRTRKGNALLFWVS